LTTCNSERFLEGQLSSILQQTRPVDEIVVGDDASTDATRSILEEFLSAAPMETHVIARTSRVGFRANIESTARRATGDIVFFADHDDVWHREKVERVVRVLHGRPRAAAFSNGRIIDAHGAPDRSDLWTRAGLDRRSRRSLVNGHALPVLLARRAVTGAALTCTSDLLAAALPFPVSTVHDHWIGLLAAATGELIPLDEPLIDYRLHGANAIGLGARNPLRRIRERIDAGDVPGREVATLSTLLDRAGTKMTAGDRSRVERAIAHHRWRTELPTGLVARAAAATRELIRGGYRRHHPSWPRSWLYDIVRGPDRARFA